jgi:ABC-type lipoprotein release transport system permease subunit
VTSPALWLALRELGVRRRRAALAVLVVAATATAATALELVGRAREEAISVQIDAIGPALTIVSPGATPGALARLELQESTLSASVEPRVRAVLGRDLRALERRLVVQRQVAGARVPVIGVEPHLMPAAFRADATVAVGSELARRLGDASSVTVEDREYPLVGALPSTGTADDAAVLMRLGTVQALSGVDGANALRLYLRAGVSPRDAEAKLARAGLDAAIVGSDRGGVADGEAQASLARHRGVAYAIMALVAGLCLLIAAHLDASERRIEMATLVAIGASRRTVLVAIVSRSAIVAVAGAAVGAAAGATLAIGQDPSLVAVVGGPWDVVAFTIAAALGIGIVAVAPTAIVSVTRDPVRELQEG